MKINFVDLKRQYDSIKDEIDNSISSVINKSSFILGSEVDDFEKKFAKLHDVNHCISVGNGTDSLFIILKSLGVGIGDEVITVCNSWISSSETISMTGAKPIFCDIRSDTLSMNTNILEKLINKNTKAIMPVHLFGNPCEMNEVLRLANKYDLYIVEDCAQAHLAEYHNKLIGTFGIASSFSFFPGKNLGAYGDAGCILTNNDSLALKCRMFARHGALEKHNHLIEGINSRMDNIQASILNVKLQYIKDWTNKRRKIARMYDKELTNLPIDLVKNTENSNSAYHLYVIISNHRDQLINHLKKNGISCAIHYPKIIPLQPAYKKYNFTKKDFPIGSKMQNKIISLPIFPELKSSEIKFVISKIKDFYKSK